MRALMFCKLGLVALIVVALVLHWLGLVSLYFIAYSIPAVGLPIIFAEEWMRSSSER